MSEKTGVVKWFCSDRGYGFVSVDDEPNDVFLHHRDIEGGGGFTTAFKGDLVKCLVVQTDDGLCCRKTRIIQSKHNREIVISSDPKGAASELSRILTPREKAVFRKYFG